MKGVRQGDDDDGVTIHGVVYSEDITRLGKRFREDFGLVGLKVG